MAQSGRTRGIHVRQGDEAPWAGPAAQPASHQFDKVEPLHKRYAPIMVLANGLVVGVLGRYGSEATQPFPPRVKTAGVILSRPAHDAAVEALQAAWEATAPWAPKVELQRKAEIWMAHALNAAGHSDVEIHVTVVDGIPFVVR